MIRDLMRSALMDLSSLVQWGLEKLTPDNPTPLGVLRPHLANDICEDCDGDCGVCQALGQYRRGAESVEELSDHVRARYFAPRESGFGAAGAYHARADRDCEVVCKGFQWIGQEWDSCAGCGRPYWEHTHMENRARDSRPFDDEWEYELISDWAKARMKARYA
jgi:hypothetical protein